MRGDGLVFGLLDLTNVIGDARVAEKYRDLTISWSRYDYRGLIVEGRSLDEILERAGATDARYCFVQSYGHIVRERWDPKTSPATDFLTALQAWATEREFLVAGPLCYQEDRWWGFDAALMLIDLEHYRRLGRPRAEPMCDSSIELPRAEARYRDGRVAALDAHSGSDRIQPSMMGWNLVASSLAHGLTVWGLPTPLRDHTLSLEPEAPERTRAFAKLLGDELSRPGLDAVPDLSAGQRELLEVVHQQTANARRGVFLWNIEAYSDVEAPPAEWIGPTSALYSVAAGFKPNRILESHGYSGDTRVVFFDYSARALEIRSEIVENWDGSDFPSFARHLFRKYPHPETFYQLWSGLTPETMQDRDLTRMWETELERWGGAARFAEHWQAYSRLEHEYVLCDLLAEPEPLLNRLEHESNAVIWFSNAFFTMHSNWYRTIAERKQRYENWISRVVAANPELLLYGSDYNNVNVNCLQAGHYWTSYRDAGSDELNPTKLYRHELRM